jgi:hypothetical protein
MQLLEAFVGPLGTTVLLVPTTTPTVPNQVLLSTSVTLDNPRRLVVTFEPGEPTTSYIIVFGRGWGNAQIAEAIYAPSVGDASTSNLDFQSVDRIISGNEPFVGSMKVDSAYLASSAWIRFDDYMPIHAIGQINAYGTVNYTVETTLEDPTEYWQPSNQNRTQTPVWFPAMSANVVGATTNQQFLFDTPSYLRITLNSSGNTPSDYVRGFFTQHSAVPVL